MTKTKYGKYIEAVPLESVPGVRAQMFHIRALEDWGGDRHLMGWSCIDKPTFMMKEAHSHHFAQLLVFLGGNPMDLTDFGAEVEIHLGEEQEKHIITTSTVVYIPGGFVHQPLNFRKVDKPIIFINIALTDERMGITTDKHA
jgi:hypothetical protein